jgi:hypothetical protein
LGNLSAAAQQVASATQTMAERFFASGLSASAAFPVLLAVAFVDIVERGAEAYEKWIHLGEETVHKIDDQTHSLRAEGDQLDVVNARLQKQIDKLVHRLDSSLYYLSPEL